MGLALWGTARTCVTKAESGAPFRQHRSSASLINGAER